MGAGGEISGLVLAVREFQGTLETREQAAMQGVAGQSVGYGQGISTGCTSALSLVRISSLDKSFIGSPELKDSWSCPLPASLVALAVDPGPPWGTPGGY